MIYLYMSTPEKHRAGIKQHYKCAVLTISTSKYRDKGEDVSGSIAKSLLMQRGHEVVYYDVIPDVGERIRRSIEEALGSDADFIITSGGTGLTRNDITIETVSGLIEKDLPGFGELFRLKSYEQVGTAAILSRAIAGVIAGKLVFCLPGSPDAVKLALEEIILPEIPHMMRHVRE